MKTFSGNILKFLNWKIIGQFPNIKKSILIFAPHTSYLDAFYGKLYLNEIGINHKFISKKELFVFPGNFIMTKFGSIPVGRTIILNITKLLKEIKELHIVISPEGQITKATKWKKGFYHMANRANVPIIVGYMDFRKKEVGIKGVIHDTSNLKSVMQQINEMYKNVSGKHNENFALENIAKNFPPKLTKKQIKCN